MMQYPPIGGWNRDFGGALAARVRYLADGYFIQ
jgi:hypothetical protein